MLFGSALLPGGIWLALIDGSPHNVLTWALLPRLVAHMILLALVALAAPFLIRRTSWPLAFGAATGTIAVLVVALFGAAISAPILSAVLIQIEASPD